MPTYRFQFPVGSKLELDLGSRELLYIFYIANVEVIVVVTTAALLADAVLQEKSQRDRLGRSELAVSLLNSNQ